METSPLAKLAPELRNILYELIFTQSQPIMLEYKWQQGWRSLPERGAYRNVLAMTETCREIREECLALFYSSNDFVLMCDSGYENQHRISILLQGHPLIDMLADS